MKPTEEIESTADIWAQAQQKCWSHVGVATAMTKVLDAFKGLSVSVAIPILSDNRPTLMLTPEEAGEIVNVKATLRLMEQRLVDFDLVESGVEWHKFPVADEWCLRCHLASGIIIDVMTRLPATKESPIEV